MPSFKDAGYGEKYFFTPENDEDLEDQPFMEDEVFDSITFR